MGKTIPQQHPAVVLRSHYKHLRTMLAIALIAVIGLSAAVVILATNDDATQTASTAAPAVATAPASAVRFDGGPEEGTRGSSSVAPSTRFDGGPEEGSRAVSVPRSASPDLSVHRSSPNVRQDGGPEEGSQEIQLRRSAPNPTTPPPLGGPRP